MDDNNQKQESLKVEQQDSQPPNMFWNKFISESNGTSPIDLALIGKYIKMKNRTFPDDKQILSYYENEFRKQILTKPRKTNVEGRKKWHWHDKTLLIWCVAKQQLLQGSHDLIPNESDWARLSQVLEVPADKLYLKWISMLHTTLKMIPWTKEEDDLLTDIASNLFKNNNWTELTIEFNKKAQTQRYAKQIRERWNNVLSPTIRKLNWTREEKLSLIQLVLDEGKRWSKIQQKMPGRTENQIKNQYNGMLRNTKKINITYEQERDLLRVILMNPPQKISLTVHEWIQNHKELKQIKANNKQKNYETDIPQPLQTVNNSLTNIPTMNTPNMYPGLYQQISQMNNQIYGYNNYTPVRQPFYQYPMAQMPQSMIPYPNFYQPMIFRY